MDLKILMKLNGLMRFPVLIQFKTSTFLWGLMNCFNALYLTCHVCRQKLFSKTISGIQKAGIHGIFQITHIFKIPGGLYDDIHTKITAGAG
jgi:hypothetical protein